MRALGTLAALIWLAACGRTPEARTAYPCTVDLTQDCAGLEEARQRVVRAYAEEAQKEAPDPVRADDIGACNRTVTEQMLSLKCFEDRCATLCALHPCATQGGVACAAGCADTVEATPIATAALEDTMLRAAERPGFCTCDVCDDASAALCTELWVCP